LDHLCYSFYLCCLIFYKIGEHEGRKVPTQGVNMRREVAEKEAKGEYGAKNVYTCM
jgi:hypothetical protein